LWDLPQARKRPGKKSRERKEGTLTRKSKTARQNTESRKENPIMDFIFCNAREQRVNTLVCQANFLKGKCHKTLLECKPTRRPKATDTQDEPESQVNSLIPIQAEPIQTREGQLDLFNLLVERKEI